MNAKETSRTSAAQKMPLRYLIGGEELRNYECMANKERIRTKVVEGHASAQESGWGHREKRDCNGIRTYNEFVRPLTRDKYKLVGHTCSKKEPMHSHEEDKDAS